MGGEHVRVLRGGNNHRVVIVENLSSEEEEPYEKKNDVNRFFDVMGVPENKQFKMQQSDKSIVVVWLDKLVIQRQRKRKGLVRTWRRMKLLMLKQFLREDYEQIIYKIYIECVQEKRTVIGYTYEFMRFSEHNELGESEIQKVARYLSGFKESLQNNMGEKEKSLATRDSNLKNNGINIPSNIQQGKALVYRKNNPNAKSTGDMCNHCNGRGHRSNVCLTRRVIVVAEEMEEEEERE
ncbi:hypothetical protein KIW84_012461 [Lathyrus oleraceus]|uniref:Retrotransposon gag domain-containing protein n=1 Tax=Pisum sativum TaxID=3888 RepID=A0A9D5GWD7_PEA|nr:hypothetical protein KIW84_012461 [Pisum sativum]